MPGTLASSCLERTHWGLAHAYCHSLVSTHQAEAKLGDMRTLCQAMQAPVMPAEPA